MSASPDPCGGRWVTGVPTATPSHRFTTTLPQNGAATCRLAKPGFPGWTHGPQFCFLDTAGKCSLVTATRE